MLEMTSWMDELILVPIYTTVLFRNRKANYEEQEAGRRRQQINLFYAILNRVQQLVISSQQVHKYHELVLPQYQVPGTTTVMVGFSFFFT